jgi:hypothetical protein
MLERVKGIEPSYSAWKAAALPLSYTRIAADQLSRRARRLNLRFNLRFKLSWPKDHRTQSTKSGQTLNRSHFQAYIGTPINNERR